MRRLLLLRHGKAAWPDGIDDSDRPLARRGRDAARRMGAYLADIPVYVITAAYPSLPGLARALADRLEGDMRHGGAAHP